MSDTAADEFAVAVGAAIDAARRVTPDTYDRVLYDHERRRDYDFCDDVRPRRALDFYMRLLPRDTKILNALQRECRHKVAPNLSVTALVKIGMDRERATTLLTHLDKIRTDTFLFQEWGAIVAASERAMQPDKRKLTTWSIRRLKRAHVSALEATIGACAREIEPMSLADLDGSERANFAYVVDTLASIYRRAAIEFLGEPGVPEREAETYLHRALSLTRWLYGPMSPRILPLLNAWYDINVKIGLRLHSTVVWHSAIAADWFQRIQVRQSPLSRGVYLDAENVHDVDRVDADRPIWLVWAPARTSYPRRTRIAERAQRAGIRLWWRTIVAWLRQKPPYAGWEVFLVDRAAFCTEPLRYRTRTVARHIDAEIREAECARVRVPSDCADQAHLFVIVAPLEQRIAQLKTIRGMLRVHDGRARAAIGDLRSGFDALGALARLPGGDAFEVVCTLGLAAVFLMEALHLVGARRHLLAVTVAAERVTSMLGAQAAPICATWRVRLMMRIAAVRWLERSRTLTTRHVLEFRRHTVMAIGAVEAAHRIDPRAAVGSSIFGAFAKRLAVFAPRAVSLSSSSSSN